MNLSGRINNLRESKSIPKVLLLLALVELFQFKVISQIPIDKLHLPGDLSTYLYRTISVATSILFIWALAPHALSRLRFKFTKMNASIFISCLLASIAIGFLHRDSGVSLSFSINAFIFALFIGLDEEIFDRGLIFGVIERFGTGIALALSSLIFGLEHFANYLYGGESFNYVLGHVIDAAGFGYLMGAVMLLFRSLYFPIFLHGVTDYPWMLVKESDYNQIVGGSADWSGILASLAVNILIARFVLWAAEPNSKAEELFMKFARRFRMIE